MALPTVTSITKAEFDKSEPSLCLFFHDGSRRFARLELPNSDAHLVFAWRSDLVEPSVIVDESRGLIWLGVDDRIASITFDGQLTFLLTLTSQLLALEPKEGSVVAVCELQAIAVRLDGSIAEIIEFPDALEDFTITRDGFSASFFGGSTTRFRVHG